MRSKINYTTKEYSKTFRLMGQAVGIKATRKTQRGIIAKKYLKASLDFQLSEFEKKIPYISFSRIKVNSVNGSYFI